ncbi:MAG: NADH-quinone oxidoreductase subunit L [Pseudomonadota bacterium]
MTTTQIHLLCILIVMAPLVGSIIAGIFGRKIGRSGGHWVTILGVGIACVLSCILFYHFVILGAKPYNGNFYTWGISGRFNFAIGFLIDRLSASMMVVVTFVSLMVHIYSIGYMADDDGYQRFFSYMSLFTFAMLMLVMANNFLQVYFGWEGVGLVSYLLIGFWFNRDSANFGSLKAFLANRVGDFGFLLAIAAIIDYTGSLDYQQVFAAVPQLANTTMAVTAHTQWSVLTVISILLFIGAMGKSAQMPLHVWLPESMEGPTPISALIHAATMVTAGVFLIARVSPIVEYSTTALSVIIVIGSTSALFTGLIAIVQHDIKRVVAYSTLSQLGYMVAALGASAFAAGMFHLFTHAFFKALLFLAAGSVIIGMHHEQDMRKMGGLWRYMPITYVTFLIGALSLSAIPPFSGFYSKDLIIDAVHHSTIPGAGYAYYCVLFGGFVTALYIFRAFFMTFHTKEKFTPQVRKHLRESPLVVTVPLVLLAIPSIFLGMYLITPILSQTQNFFGQTITVKPSLNVLGEIATHYHGAFAKFYDAVFTLPFWFAIAGIIVPFVCYVLVPSLPSIITRYFAWIYRILVNKYGFDDFNQIFFVHGTRKLANSFYKFSDQKLVDDWMVNGSGRFINWVSKNARKLQTGYLFHYAFAMILGLLIFMLYLLV